MSLCPLSGLLRAQGFSTPNIIVSDMQMVRSSSVCGKSSIQQQITFALSIAKAPTFTVNEGVNSSVVSPSALAKSADGVMNGGDYKVCSNLVP